MGYLSQKKVGIGDTDASGRIFFISLQRMCVEVIEEFLSEGGFDLREMFRFKDYSIVIRHVEVDYFHPISLCDQLIVELILAKVGEKSYTFNLEIKHQLHVVASMLVVQVAIDKKTERAIPLPLELRKVLLKLS